MYARSAEYYDLIYAWKDYARDIGLLTAHLHRRDVFGGLWLDVACGTGKHLSLIPTEFEPFGVEIDEHMRERACARLPNARIEGGDMRTFDLGIEVDVVTCLFSSIGYMTEPEDLAAALANMARHLRPGGVMIVEPWFTPRMFRDRSVHGDVYGTEDIRIARVARSWVEGPVSCMEMHHLIALPDHVEHFVENHRMGLFTDLEYKTAFAQAGLDAERDEYGLMGRGLYLAVKG